MYLSRVSIRNIRCFDKLDLRFGTRTLRPDWTMIVGDNATGKTALLKSIAIGLCDVSSAAGLLRESDSGYIRHGKKWGTIVIDLKDPNSRRYKIFTKIERVAIRSRAQRTDYYERVTQWTYPRYHRFPWGKIFACAYGAGRGTIGTGDISGYSVINAVYNMFNYSEGLQNPELMLRRISAHSIKFKSELLRNLKNILYERFPKNNKYKVLLDNSGVLVDGPWGKNMPLRDIADGYKSTFLWITDFLGWALSFNPQIKTFKEIRGIVIIDELEEHLHPKWQKFIVEELRNSFPNVQFITTTHSPLIASSIVNKFDQKNKSRLIHLALQTNNKVTSMNLNGTVTGLDVDQLLASRAFDYLTSYDEKVEKLLLEASKIASKKKKSIKDKNRYIQVKNILEHFLLSEKITPFEIEMEKDNLHRISTKAKQLENKLFGEQID